ncbi:MAG: thioredoxin domain-containing protein [Bacteroides sp.]|nr:thioredoxin domain-containing protein [Bacteroides sp.]
MTKVFISLLLVLAGVGTYACTVRSADKEAEKVESVGSVAKSGEVISMNKAMFLERVFDYETSQEWNYKGDKPAIIDLYADWCGPCRQVALIMKELAKEYDRKIVIYKVDVDKEKELAALFQATSIPLFVFIPREGEPQLFRGAADKATYTQAIEEFLLGNKAE